MRTVGKRIALCALAALLWLAPQGAGSRVYGLGIGLAPSSIVIENALRGAAYDRTLFVMNPSAEESEYELLAEGYAAGWITFRLDEESAVAAAGPVHVGVPPEGRTRVIATIAVPDDAAEGVYDASIIVRLNPPEGAAQEGASAVGLEATGLLQVHVTGTQVLTGEVGAITVRDTEPGYPLRIDVQFRNTGNVVARPEVLVELYLDGQAAGTQSLSDMEIKPETSDWIRIEGATAGLQPGEYRAHVTVTLGGLILKEEDLTFRLLPVGTLSRQGEFVELSTQMQPVVGQMFRVNALFANTGTIETPAQFFGEVYRDRALIDTIESRTLVVLPGERQQLAAYFMIDEPGEYRVRGQIDFGGKTTDTLELVFQSVSAAPGPARPLPVHAVRAESDLPLGLDGRTVALGLGSALIVVALLVLLFTSIRSRRQRPKPRAF